MNKEYYENKDHYVRFDIGGNVRHIHVEDAKHIAMLLCQEGPTSEWMAYMLAIDVKNEIRRIESLQKEVKQKGVVIRIDDSNCKLSADYARKLVTILNESGFYTMATILDTKLKHRDVDNKSGGLSWLKDGCHE